MEQGDGLHIPLDGNSSFQSRFAVNSVPAVPLVTVVWFLACFSVGRNLRRRNPLPANAYRFPAEEDNIDWVEYRFRLIIQKMVAVILILLIVLLFQLYPVKKQQ